MSIDSYIQTLKHINDEILRSRYQIAKVANKKMLFLYFKVGNVISTKVAKEKWGSKTIEKLSADLQNELKGLRGFSSANLKKMKQFYEVWQLFIDEDILQNENSPLLAGQFKKNEHKNSSLATNQLKESNKANSSLLTNQLVKHFTSVCFTAHYEIITKTKSLEAKVFYITKTAQEFWTVETLKHNFKNDLFKPEYLGKMNFYLSALDEYVKQEYEKPSIGIILCKEKKNKIVEFSFRDFDKAMGVATYNTGKKLPEKYQNILPDAKTLKKLMD